MIMRHVSAFVIGKKNKRHTILSVPSAHSKKHLALSSWIMAHDITGLIWKYPTLKTGYIEFAWLEFDADATLAVMLSPAVAMAAEAHCQ